MSEVMKREVKPSEKMERTTMPPLTPFGLMRRFTEEMENIFNDFETIRFPRMWMRDFIPLRTEMKELDWVPPIEVKHKDGTLLIRCELPGMNREDIEVKLEPERLAISGERKEEKEEKGEGFYRSERSYGKFNRQIAMPPGVQPETAAATFRDGVLEITMKVATAEPKTRKLEIKGPTKEKAAAATA